MGKMGDLTYYRDAVADGKLCPWFRTKDNEAVFRLNSSKDSFGMHQMEWRDRAADASTSFNYMPLNTKAPCAKEAMDLVTLVVGERQVTKRHGCDFQLDYWVDDAGYKKLCDFFIALQQLLGTPE